ncbi:hypothetical protein ACFQY7_17505 [Actinomadura luteofluorescens]|uniref:hypothetical protein n=1 Tax=Actinomadura luteofluorescens TaxID=46163 RepID=UPI00362A9662
MTPKRRRRWCCWMCRAGTATRLPHQLTIGRRRSVVLAASAAADPAFDADFTRAVITALTKVADGRYDVARGFGFVSPDQVARDIEAMVAAPGYGQQVTCSLHSLLDDVPRFRFFPNLTPHDADQLPEGIDPGIGDLAVGLDPAHFIDRAYASGLFPRMATGLFQGRDRLLQQLSAWLDGTTASAPPGPLDGTGVEGAVVEGAAGGRLRVVTGSPGSGKSALLGVLVCAAHPQLRAATDPAWNRLAHVPSRNQELVAVHARQLTTQQVIDSLARQLRLPPPNGTSPDPADTAGAGAEPRGDAADAAARAAGSPAQAARWEGRQATLREGWNMQDLLEGIAAAPTPPVIVIDALDEAAQPAELRQLLLQLADRTGGQESHDEREGGAHDRSGRNGDPRDGGGCRLLVGTRRWRQFTPMLERARAHGGLIDLDEEPAGEVRQAITGYVTALLARQAPYDTAAYANARTAFAVGLATALTTAPHRSPALSVPGGWTAGRPAHRPTRPRVRSGAL